MNNFKIDLSDSKNSSDGTILSKVKNFQKHICEHENRGLDIYIKSPLASSCTRKVKIEDRCTGIMKEVLMFGSNSYLDATTITEAVNCSIETTKRFGIGSGGVPLLSGTTIPQRNLEKQIAELKGFDDAILFSSGFTANIGAIIGLIRPNNLLVFDKLNHASLIDGAIMSMAKMLRYKHDDMESLERILKEKKDDFLGGIMIVTDSVFSMDGDIANIPSIIELANEYDAMVLIDDAHATGVIGEKGAGSLSHYGIKERKNIIVTGTLSKAIGCIGGFITASQEIIDYLRIYARSNMYSTSLPPSVCASASQIIKKFSDDDVISLKNKSTYIRAKLKKMGFNTLNSQTPIIPVIIGDQYILTEMIKDFYLFGIYLNFIFPPIVSPKQSRIRISIMISHTKEDLDYLADVFEKIGKKYDVI